MRLKVPTGVDECAACVSLWASAHTFIVRLVDFTVRHVCSNLEQSVDILYVYMLAATKLPIRLDSQ